MQNAKQVFFTKIGRINCYQIVHKPILGMWLNTSFFLLLKGTCKSKKVLVIWLSLRENPESQCKSLICEFAFVLGALKSANFYHLAAILVRGQDRPRQYLHGTITSGMNIEVRFHWGDQLMLSTNSASNKRNTEIYRLFRLKIIDRTRKLYVFVKEFQFSLIFCTCPHLHGLCL